MKKQTSLFTSTLLIVGLLSSSLFAAEDSFPAGRVAATGVERNGDGQDVTPENQSGVTVLGAGSSQVKTCMGCQTSASAGLVRLSSSNRRASPGIKQQIGADSSSSDSVNTGN